MMKIGIITYYDVVNYGAVLLAYAMQKYFENMGFEVSFLKYNRKTFESKKEKTSFYRWLKFQTPNAKRAKRQETKKRKNFQIFRDKYLNEGDYYHQARNIDILVIGSDQIFDCKNEFNDYQFGINSPCSQIVAYAPSFGEIDYCDIDKLEYKNDIANALKSFKALSSRDENTRKLIKKLTGKEAQMVLDPVLLYGFEIEKQNWNRCLVEEDYLIIYAWGGVTTTKTFEKEIRKFAKHNHLKTVSVGDRRPWCDYDFSDASPIEFFELFRNCSMVITNMFHGTCFSILNEKPFYSIVMPHNKNKVEGLLHQMGLTGQMVKDIGVLGDSLKPDIDYKSVSADLEKRKNTSRQYIRNAFL